MKITEIKEKDAEYGNANTLLGVYTIVFDDAIIVNDVKLIRKKDGEYQVCWPRLKSISRELCHPITVDFGKYCKQALIDFYEVNKGGVFCGI